ncbi:MAG: ATP-dependent RecD-like DNA helicase [Erysipelotrichaceae bacterium]|nr:ATP-dependent RecD-like DNA helicase [Erysipelotrichaceae bacterium]
MSEEKESLRGKFGYCLFNNGSYAVYRFQSDGESIVVTGPLSGIDKEREYLLKGEYVMHPRFGFQFKVETYETLLPSEEEECLRLLSGGLFKGIGMKTAEKIVAVMGADCLQQLKEDPSLIETLPITARQKQALREGFEVINDPLEEQRRLFLTGGLSSRDCTVIINTFREDLFGMLERDPYEIFYTISGIGFRKIDHYCLASGIPEDDLRRKRALFVSILEDLCFRSGNVWQPREELLKRYRRDSGYPDADFVLQDAVDEFRIVEEGERLYPFAEYQAERTISELLPEYGLSEEYDSERIEDWLSALEEEEGIVYDQKQADAIFAFFRNRFSLITGGPGTGKTTIVKALVTLSRQEDPYALIKVAAPTGRAAKRISELCGVDSCTIHSLLGWDKETNTFSFNEQNPILLDTLIIDEFSMVDSQLFASILKACGAVRRICIIGDSAQLPSIRPGNVLHDLLDCGLFPCTKLSANFRQRKGNEIIALAADILKGESDLNDYHNDVVFLNTPSEDSQVLLQQIEEKLQEGYSMEDIQVLAPMYAGGLGIDALNHLLQETYNPLKPNDPEVRSGKRSFRIGDKILQLKNQPGDDVYNGDIGILCEINIRDKTLIVQFDDTYVEYAFDDLENITLAYAVSVHKAQGSEYPIVFLMISRYHRIMLEKSLIYTAATRAKRELILIGDEEAFYQGISRTREQRQTTLKERLLGEI